MMGSDRKPDPDALLQSIKREEGKSNQGHLRIFLGMCPGVGKTYAMLQAAQEKKRSGARVLAGIVETHGRQETKALLEGLELAPRKTIEYREKTFGELNVDLVLHEKPDLVLVDELAHTNIPGSRHPKRYQDVKEILDAGIDVYTTMNVQHLESRIDLVKQITGITVHETVTDSFFELADQVELVDLPPSELLKRLKQGKVYLGEMAERAIEGFFQEEHLLALRELALRFTAEVVEGELHDQMVKKQIAGPWQTRERLLVAISHSPYSRRLIRAARRKAFNMEAHWIALYIDVGGTLSEDDKAMLRKNMEMARELGAELITVRESNIPAAIRRVAEEKNVTQIVMGRPDRRFWRDFVNGGTILDKLVRETSEIDIHVLRQVRKPRFRGFTFRLPPLGGELSQYSNVFWVMAAVTGLGAALEPLIQYQAVGFLFLLAVLIVGAFADRGPTLFSAILSSFAWDYFFIPPKYTFHIAEVADLMMCFSYFAVAMTASLFMTKIKRQSQELQERAARTGRLYDFSRELASSPDVESIVGVSSRFVERILGGACSIFFRDESGKLKEKGHSPSGRPVGEKQAAVAVWVNENGKRAGFGTDTLAGSDVLCLPIKGRQGVLGVLLYFPGNRSSLSVEEETTLESICASVAVSIDRENFRKDTEGLRMLEESERLYQTIFDSVSHELRTPITSIMGAASALQDQQTAKTQENRVSLTDEIIRGTQRLNRVVENLLDISRLNAGQLTLKKDLIDLSESIETLAKEYGADVETEDGVYVEVDPKLLKSALEQLLRNGQVYSPPGGRVLVKVQKKSSVAVLDVIDECNRIDEADRKKIFQKFYRIKGTAAGGLGLGLSIAKAIVEAHGGAIDVLSRIDKPGNVFRIELPLWAEKIPEA